MKAILAETRMTETGLRVDTWDGHTDYATADMTELKTKYTEANVGSIYLANFTGGLTVYKFVKTNTGLSFITLN